MKKQLNSTINNHFISVVVSTMDRSVDLERCLNSLIKQKGVKGLYEVIVIDNASSDNTKEVVTKFSKKHEYIKYFYEVKLGLSHARNRGWKEAQGKYVAYIDDDSIADKNWINNIIKFINNKPNIDSFGGPFTRYTLVDPPVWFPTEYGTKYLGKKTRQLEIGKEFINGTNMIYSKKILTKLNGFNPNLGMKGNTVLYGEETELQMRIKNDGKDIYYVPNIVVSHLLDERKMSLRWLYMEKYGLGKTIVTSHGRKDTLFYHIGSFTDKTIRFLYYFLKPEIMPFKRRIYYATAGYLSAYGAFENYLKNKFKQ